MSTYHAEELARLVEHLRGELARLDADQIDVFEFDDVVYQYKKAAQKLWSFCNSGHGRFGYVARLIEEEREQGGVTDWWGLAAPRRR